MLEEVSLDVDWDSVTWADLIYQWIEYMLYIRNQCPMVVSELYNVAEGSSKVIQRKYETFLSVLREVKKTLEVLQSHGCSAVILCMGNNVSIPSEIYTINTGNYPLTSGTFQAGSKGVQKFLREVTKMMSSELPDIGMELVSGVRGIKEKNVRPKSLNQKNLAKKSTSVVLTLQVNNPPYNEDEIWYQFTPSIKGIPIDSVSE